MADRTNTLLAFGLLAAIGAYLVTQSEKGKNIAQVAVDTGSDIIESVANVFGSARGLRNNNPGNIRRTGVSWQGMAPTQSDASFIQFISPEYGIRAMARILKNYIAGGYNTIQEIINRWAPPIENDTGAYVRAVSSSLGVAPNTPIDDSNLPALIAAIIQHENGQQPYSGDVIARGVQLEQTA